MEQQEKNSGKKKKEGFLVGEKKKEKFGCLMIPHGIVDVGKDEFSAAELQTLQSLPASGAWKIHQVRK